MEYTDAFDATPEGVSERARRISVDGWRLVCVAYKPEQPSVSINYGNGGGEFRPAQPAAWVSFYARP